MNTVAYGLGLGPGTGGTTNVVVFDAGSVALVTAPISAEVVDPQPIAVTVVTPIIE
jgi:hypothetical protein